MMTDAERTRRAAGGGANGTPSSNPSHQQANHSECQSVQQSTGQSAIDGPDRSHISIGITTATAKAPATALPLQQSVCVRSFGSSVADCNSACVQSVHAVLPAGPSAVSIEPIDQQFDRQSERASQRGHRRQIALRSIDRSVG